MLLVAPVSTTPVVARPPMVREATRVLPVISTVFGAASGSGFLQFNLMPVHIMNQYLNVVLIEMLFIAWVKSWDVYLCIVAEHTQYFRKTIRLHFTRLVWKITTSSPVTSSHASD
uniref:Uncharacterized protein n=1 Tax=Glossina palpalis gambiensis TaxID=67801 RepID=A0A1B0BTT7_9MUSC